MSTRTALYRHFDSAGGLLYVGISLNSINRTAQHRQGAKWFEQIARIQIEWHPSRDAALAAEAIAIAAEGPVWNIARPIGASVVRVAPYPSSTVEVRCRGEALDPILWCGDQWAVTEYGIEARDGCYAISVRRLLERRGSRYEWPEHMREKEWVDMVDFQKTFAVACWLHHGVPIAQHRAAERA